jgi:hypothetical protein
MDISYLDFALINILSYFSGIATGLIVCCKYKDNILIRSRSRDNLSNINHRNDIMNATPIVASAPPPTAVAKITLE